MLKLKCLIVMPTSANNIKVTSKWQKQKPIQTAAQLHSAACSYNLMIYVDLCWGQKCDDFL